MQLNSPLAAAGLAAFSFLGFSAFGLAAAQQNPRSATRQLKSMPGTKFPKAMGERAWQ